MPSSMLPIIAICINAVALLVGLLRNSNAGIAQFAEMRAEQRAMREKQESDNKALREDFSELKNAVLKIAEATTQMAVFNSMLSSEQTEMMRTRDRLHELEGHVRGILAWRQSADPLYGKRET